jgi:hypothetical protein
MISKMSGLLSMNLYISSLLDKIIIISLSFKNIGRITKIKEVYNSDSLVSLLILFSILTKL